MTNFCSSKTDFICIFSCVFRCGRFVGSSRLEVSHLYLFGISPLPLLNISIKLEFASIGVLLQKLYMFWFSWCWQFLPGGCTGRLGRLYHPCQGAVLPV